MAKVPKDLVLTKSANRGGVDGQFPTVQGDQVLPHAIMLAMGAGPGELTFRPNYGAGLMSFVGYAAAPSKLMALALAARKAAEATPGVESATASAQSTDGGRVLVRLAYKRRSAPDSELLTFTLDPSAP